MADPPPTDAHDPHGLAAADRRVATDPRAAVRERYAIARPGTRTMGPPTHLRALFGPEAASARWGLFFSLVWLVYLGPAVGDAFDGDRTTVARIGAGLLVVVFVPTYLSILVSIGDPDHVDGPRARVMRSVLARTAVLVTVGLVGLFALGNEWLVVAPYITAILVMIVPARLGPIAVVASIGLGQILLSLVPPDDGRVGIALGTGIAGFATLGFRRFRDVLLELREAREENARLAVADERLRIARELHDLLGHGLSVIAVKSQLAERLLDRGDTARAAEELRDVRGVAADALHEVRHVVADYRRRPLATEVASAADALRAGELEVETELPTRPVPDHVQDVVAYVVREGTTNVLRHARATRCTVAVRREDDAVVVTLVDDGIGATPTPRTVAAVEPGPGAEGGTGLGGLADRLEAVDGTLRIGPGPDGGTVLEATVPVDELPAATDPAAVA